MSTPTEPPARPARRLARARWRDPRLLLGIFLVIASTVVAARWAAAQDDRVAYWSLSGDVRSGQKVTRGDLEPAKVRLDGAASNRYLRVSDELPATLSTLVWSHDASAGELVRIASLRPQDDAPGGELPLKVAMGAFPGDLSAGDLVDVWVSPAQGDATGDAVRALARTRVLGLGGEANAVGGSLARTVVVAVKADTDPARALAAVGRGAVTLVRVP